MNKNLNLNRLHFADDIDDLQRVKKASKSYFKYI